VGTRFTEYDRHEIREENIAHFVLCRLLDLPFASFDYGNKLCVTFPSEEGGLLHGLMWQKARAVLGHSFCRLRLLMKMCVFGFGD